MGVGASDDRIGPADIDGYTNKSNSGAAGGGWGLTQQDPAGYEQWLAFTAHSDGLAVVQKNDGDNTATDEPYFDGMIMEECNHYDDPCGSGGDNTNLYIAAHKPVLNAEYTEDGESTAKFCSADDSAGITGALFNVDLDGKSYQICQTGAGYVYAAGGGVVTTTTSTTTPTKAKPVKISDQVRLRLEALQRRELHDGEERDAPELQTRLRRCQLPARVGRHRKQHGRIGERKPARRRRS